jgi:predicted ABC-type ATPase
VFTNGGIALRTYTIIAGVNGVGKSSLTGVLKAERNDLGFVVDVDKLAVENSLSALDAGKTALSRIEVFLSKNISFAQETTLSGQRTEKTVRLAKEKGYAVRLFYIGLNTCEEALKRIQNRVEKGGHNIPAHDVTRRHKKRFDDLIKVLPYCDEVRFFDNENGFVEVGEYKNGEIISKGDYKPLWLLELVKLFTPRPPRPTTSV